MGMYHLVLADWAEEVVDPAFMSSGACAQTHRNGPVAINV